MAICFPKSHTEGLAQATSLPMQTQAEDSHALHKPVGISTVVSIILGHCQAAQSHQGPLHRRHVFACEKEQGRRTHLRGVQTRLPRQGLPPPLRETAAGHRDQNQRRLPWVPWECAVVSLRLSQSCYADPSLACFGHSLSLPQPPAVHPTPPALLSVPSKRSTVWNMSVLVTP